MGVLGWHVFSIGLALFIIFGYLLWFWSARQKAKQKRLEQRLKKIEEKLAEKQDDKTE